MAAGRGSAAEERRDDRAVELSLRLRTGSSAAAAGEGAAANARRSMTIFYNGRVCAVDVTERQASAIITMANHQILTGHQQQQQRVDSDRHLQDCSSSSSSNNNTAAEHHDNPKPLAPTCPAPLPASPPRPQGLIGAAEVARAAPVVISQAAAAGLSMKRSLQQFLQKRKTRVAAVRSPYAGGRPTRHSALPS